MSIIECSGLLSQGLALFFNLEKLLSKQFQCKLLPFLVAETKAEHGFKGKTEHQSMERVCTAATVCSKVERSWRSCWRIALIAGSNSKALSRTGSAPR